MEKVTTRDSKERVDAAIAMPVNLSDETRKFEVTSWKPIVSGRDFVRVQIEVIVLLKAD